MTKEEWNALNDEEKQDWLEIFETTMKIWESERGMIKLPYPENLIRYVYGRHCVIKKPLDGIMEELVDTLPDYCKSIVKVIFKDHSDIKVLADEMGVISSTAVNYVKKVPRLLRHASRARRFQDYVEMISDDE